MNWKQALLLASVGMLLTAGAAASYLTSPDATDDGRLKVVATFYPLYYFSCEIAGDRASVSNLIPFNSEPHSWEPKPSDIVRVDKAGVFVYNGAGIEPWAGDLLSALQNRERMQVVDSSKGLALMSGDADNPLGLNPHFWVDPVLAKRQVDNILDGFEKADPANAAYYVLNAEDLKARLDALDMEFRDGLANRTKDLILTTHEGFDYLAARYNFTARAILGLEPNQQPSAARLSEMVKLVEEYDLSVVFGEPVYSDAYMKTISNEVKRQSGRDVRVLVLDGIHGRSGPHAGLDYFGIQRANLESLRLGLGVA